MVKLQTKAFSTCKILINGHDRFSAKNASYFRTLHPNEVGHKVPEKHVYCYSFALKPEEHQPRCMQFLKLIQQIWFSEVLQELMQTQLQLMFMLLTTMFYAL